LQLELDQLYSQYQQLLAEETEIEKVNDELKAQIDQLQPNRLDVENKEIRVMRDSESVSSDFEEEFELKEVAEELLDITDEDQKCCGVCRQSFDANFKYDNQKLSDLLSQEITEFLQRIDSANATNVQVIDELIATINSIITRTFNVNCILQVYGSYASGLNMPWSDIDLLLTPEGNPNTLDLELLAESIKANDCFEDVRYIKSASVPVLKLTSSSVYNHVQVDITLMNPSHYGVECANLIKQYLSIYPSLKPLTLILKQLLSAADLNDPYQQGLSSYGLVLMIVAFLQHKEQLTMHSEENPNLGQILCELLMYYGSSFDYQKWKIVPQLPINNQGAPFRRVS